MIYGDIMNNMQQQSPLEFLKWIPVNGEKHLGIAVIRYERRFIFRFKVMSSEHGGYWCTTAAFKTGFINGKDKYEAAFQLDSDYEKDAMNEFVIQHVTAAMQRVNTNPQNMGYNTQLPQSTPYPHSFAPQSQNYNATSQNSFDDRNAPVDDNLPF